jgi:2-dehydro-3-deoxyphosphogluconate aldolase / (4S)-4-hydroxy-2-oxoglutarate aldolase
MKKDEVCALIRKLGILPAVRVSSADDAHFAVEAITQGGIPIVEITLTVPGAVELISHLVRHHPKVTVGAGTVLDVETARRCMDAGASFLTSPGFDLEIVQFAAKENLTVVPGAWTATEVMVAWKAGSDFVKVFPCVQAGGDKHIKALHTSLPQIPLIAAGGVNQQNAASFILSGASAIGVGTELIPTEAIEQRESGRIRELAHRFRGFVEEARRLIDEAREKSAVLRKFTETEKCKK